MRQALPVLLLVLSACSQASPVMTSAPTTPQISPYWRYMELSSDPMAAQAYLDAELAAGRIDAELWYSLLEILAETGNQSVFTRLTQAAANIPGAELQRRRASILARAASGGQTEFLKWLLTDPQWQSVGFNLNQDEENYRATPLIEAIQTSQTETVNWLLEKGADVNQASRRGENPLSAAVYRSDRPMIEKLLAKGANLNPTDSQPPLFMAVLTRDHELFQYLLDKGANLHATWIEPSDAQIIGAKPISVLNVAIRNDYDNQMLKFLLDKGATPDRPEHASAVASFIDNRYYSDPGELEPGVQQAFERLLKYKPNLRAANNYGETALGLAVKRGQIKSLTEMIAAGADLNISDDEGKTLLMYAAESGSLVMAQFLLYRGADIKVKDLRGQRALDYAGDASMRNYLSSIPTR